MPITAEQVTDRAHADMNTASLNDTDISHHVISFEMNVTTVTEKGCANIHIPRTSTVASFLTVTEICEISKQSRTRR